MKKDFVRALGKDMAQAELKYTELVNSGGNTKEVLEKMVLIRTAFSETYKLWTGAEFHFYDAKKSITGIDERFIHGVADPQPKF